MQVWIHTNESCCGSDNQTETNIFSWSRSGSRGSLRFRSEYKQSQSEPAPQCVRLFAKWFIFFKPHVWVAAIQINIPYAVVKVVNSWSPIFCLITLLPAYRGQSTQNASFNFVYSMHSLFQIFKQHCETCFAWAALTRNCLGIMTPARQFKQLSSR